MVPAAVEEFRWRDRCGFRVIIGECLFFFASQIFFYIRLFLYLDKQFDKQ